MFVLLAIVFGASFVFLGVGSGSSSGLGDVFSTIFGGSSGVSVEDLQKKVAENPQDKTAVVDLAAALERDGRTDEAIATYRTYLAAHPKSVEILSNLAIVYQTQAGTAYNEVSDALRESSLAAPAAQFRPGSGALGQALDSFIDPISQTASTVAEQKYQQALARYTSANKDALGIYKQLSKLAPSDSSALLRYAQAAEAAQELKVASAAYAAFIKRFPNDSLVADARKRLKELKQQIAQQAASVQVPSTPGQTG
jgi:thioredoxin-like negative regulator of GroEL